MITAQRMFRLALSVTLVMTVGCSLFLTEAPDPHEPSVEPTCDRSAIAPTADVVASVILGIAAIVTASAPCLFCSAERQQEAQAENRLPALGVGAVAIGYAVVGARGYSKIGRCREAHEFHRAQQSY
jgi:hypothetical protein